DKQDGLAWQNPDGSWGGPIGEKIARAIEQGYSASAEPYHGYFFKILKGQGPAARSEEHTSELQSLRHLVCRLLLEKKKKKIIENNSIKPKKSDQNQILN